MGRDVFYRLGEKRNKILDVKYDRTIDKIMSNIILNYKNLIISKVSKESLIDMVEYKLTQMIVYFIKIKNDPQIFERRLLKIKLPRLRKN